MYVLCTRKTQLQVFIFYACTCFRKWLRLVVVTQCMLGGSCIIGQCGASIASFRASCQDGITMLVWQKQPNVHTSTDAGPQGEPGIGAWGYIWVRNLPAWTPQQQVQRHCLLRGFCVAGMVDKSAFTVTKVCQCSSQDCNSRSQKTSAI